jgi:hypothetical protein
MKKLQPELLLCLGPGESSEEQVLMVLPLLLLPRLRILILIQTVKLLKMMRS